MSGIAPRSMTQRMIGAAKLDIDVYEEVEADTSATGQAAGVVAIVALCSALGGIAGGAQGVFGGLIAALLGWALWAGITYLIGDKLLGGTATWGELLRTLGFAQAPGVLFLLDTGAANQDLNVVSCIEAVNGSVSRCRNNMDRNGHDTEVKQPGQ